MHLGIYLGRDLLYFYLVFRFSFLVAYSYHLLSVFIQNLHDEIPVVLLVFEKSALALIDLVNLKRLEILLSAHRSDRNLEKFLIEGVTPRIRDDSERAKDIKVVWPAVLLADLEVVFSQVFNSVRRCIAHIIKSNVE